MESSPRSGSLTLSFGAVLAHRVIWAAMVLGQVAFAVVIGIILANGGGPTKVALAGTAALVIDGVLLAAGVVLAVVFRFRRVDAAGAPAAVGKQVVRNLIVPMAALEAASFVGLAVWFVSGQWWPIVVVPAAAVLVQLSLVPKRTVRVR